MLLFFANDDSTRHIVRTEVRAPWLLSSELLNRAIARYSVVKELNRAVVAAGPPLPAGRSKLLKCSQDVNLKLTFFSSPESKPENRLRCFELRLPSGLAFASRRATGTQSIPVFGPCQNLKADSRSFFRKANLHSLLGLRTLLPLL